MKPIGYYLCTELPQDVETVLTGLSYAEKIDVGRGIIDLGRHEAPANTIIGSDVLETFVSTMPRMERVRLGASLIIIAVDEFDRAEAQKRREGVA